MLPAGAYSSSGVDIRLHLGLPACFSSLRGLLHLLSNIDVQTHELLVQPTGIAPAAFLQRCLLLHPLEGVDLRRRAKVHLLVAEDLLDQGSIAVNLVSTSLARLLGRSWMVFHLRRSLSSWLQRLDLRSGSADTATRTCSDLF